jgi:putative hydrolase
MKIFADYHTHTIYSHGKGTIQQNVEAALKQGLKEIAITDHGPGHILYGIKKKDIFKMKKEIDQMNQLFPQIKIKLGLEANIIGKDGKLDVDKEMTKHLDILLAGYHFGALSKDIINGIKIHGGNLLSRYFPTVASKIRVLNTDAVVAAIYNNNIDILTHPGAKANIDTKEVAKAAAQRGTALEINSSHGYLTVEYIKIAMKENVKFVINSDAHRPEDVGNVQLGIEKAMTAGLEAYQVINV